MSMYFRISDDNTHLSWDSMFIILFLTWVYIFISQCVSREHALFYKGCALGTFQALIVHELYLYLVEFLENGFHIDLSKIFGHIQLAPYTPTTLDSDDDEGYSEDDENEKND